MAALLDYEQSEEWDEDRGPEPLVAHVFVVDPANPDLGVDIKGRRPLSEIKAEWHDLIDPRIEELGESELLDMMGEDRPLYECGVNDYKDAVAVIQKDRLLD